MSMSKQDYELIARVIRQAAIPTLDERTRIIIASELSWALLYSNIRFDRAKFLKACHVPDHMAQLPAKSYSIWRAPAKH